jgi:hypothetical protein
VRLSSLSSPVLGAGASLLFAGCSGVVTPSVPAGAASQSIAARPASGVATRVGPSLAEQRGLATAPPGTGPGFTSAAVDSVGGAAIYLTDDAANTITVFSNAFKVTAQLTGLGNPSGIARDSSGDIYVANSGAQNIVEYTRGLKSVKATLADSGYEPIGVSVDSASGTVGVANVIADELGPGSVTFYAKGATTPCTTVSDSNWNSVYFDAFDARGDLYIDGVAKSGETLVGVVSGGCAAKKITTLRGASLAFPGSIDVLKDGSILLDDQGTGHGSTVYEYAPPANGKFAKPRATVVLASSIDVVSVSLDATEKHLFGADAEASNNKEFQFPAGGLPIRTFSGPISLSPTGILVTPEAKI